MTDQRTQLRPASQYYKGAGNFTYIICNFILKNQHGFEFIN